MNSRCKEQKCDDDEDQRVEVLHGHAPLFNKEKQRESDGNAEFGVG